MRLPDRSRGPPGDGVAVEGEGGRFGNDAPGLAFGLRLEAIPRICRDRRNPCNGPTDLGMRPSEIGPESFCLRSGRDRYMLQEFGRLGRTDEVLGVDLL